MGKKLLVLAAVAALAGCSGAGGDNPSATSAPTETVLPADSIEITAVDYAFEGVPETVSPGTSFTLVNESDMEVHEAVIAHIPDDETRSIQELIELPPEEAESIVQTQGVLVALPREGGHNPEAGGAFVTVTDPGRYAILCFIPQGADPAAIKEAMSGESEGPPQLEGGPPHAVLGMVAEFTVES